MGTEGLDVGLGMRGFRDVDAGTLRHRGRTFLLFLICCKLQKDNIYILKSSSVVAHFQCLRILTSQSLHPLFPF